MARTEMRAWQRTLKNDRLESRVSINGHHVHVIGGVETVDAVLEAFERATGGFVETFERRRPLFDRPRPPKVINGQLSLEDGFQ